MRSNWELDLYSGLLTFQKGPVKVQGILHRALECKIDNFKYELLLLIVTSTKPKGNMFSALIVSMR